MLRTTQGELFHESAEEAVRALVAALGGMKRVGAELRPTLPVDQAGRWLAQCLDAERAEKLSLADLVFLLRAGRSAGVHVAAAWLLREAGYADPVPVDPLSETERLQREVLSATTVLRDSIARLERLQAGAR